MLSQENLESSGYLQKPDFLLSVANQLNKDFALGEYFIEPTPNTLLEIQTKLQRLVSDLLETDNEKLFAILYRIDLKESVVKETFQEGKMDTEKLCEQILYRECLKVYFRIKYSQ